MELKFFKTKNNEEIAFYYTDNKKPNVLLIHGNYSNAMQWMSKAEQLSEDYNVLVPELRGFGHSSYHTPINTLEELAADLVELVEDLNLSDISVIGWSLGGGVAIEFVYLAQARVKNLVLTASMGITGYPMFQFDETMQPILDQPLRTKEDIANSLYYLPMVQMIENDDREQMKAAVMGMHVKTTPDDKFVDEFIEAMKMQKNLLDADYALLNFNVTNKSNGVFEGSGHIDQIKVPILIIHGDQDLMVLPDLARASKAYLGDQAELVLLEGASHSLHIDSPQEWDLAVLSFIE